MAYFFVLFSQRPIMNKLCLSVLAAFIGAISFAQDGETKKVDVNINTDGGGGWYNTPWVWIVGGAVFILLLVALMRGGGRRAD